MSGSWTRALLLGALAGACSAPPPPHLEPPAEAARGPRLDPCGAGLDALLRPTDDEELARAMYERGRRAPVDLVIDAYEEAVTSCHAHARRGAWLERLAKLHLLVGDEAGGTGALRSLACANRYPYGAPLPSPAVGPFRDPYEACRSAEVEPFDDAARKRVFDSWMRLGARHSDPTSAADAFWAQRASSALRHAVAVAPAAERPLAELDLARVLYRQERLAAAFELFAGLLERQERGAGRTLYPSDANGASGQLPRAVVAESIVSAASAIAAVDFEGPSPLEPASEREDPLSRAASRAEMAAMLRVSLDRANDPRLLPDDREWSAAVAMQLAHLLADLHLSALEIEAYGILVRRWPLYRYRPNALFELASLLESEGRSLAARSTSEELQRTLSPGSVWMTEYDDDAEAQELVKRYRAR